MEAIAADRPIDAHSKSITADYIRRAASGSNKPTAIAIDGRSFVGMARLPDHALDKLVEMLEEVRAAYRSPLHVLLHMVAMIPKKKGPHSIGILRTFQDY